MNDREALDYLASAVIEEAKRENVLLSDDDKRLLYFSAVDPRSAMGISESRLQSDDQEFEGTVTRLLAAAVQNPSTDKLKFEEAVRTLERGDYYILVMAAAARSSQYNAEGYEARGAHKTRDVILYLLISGAIVAALVAYIVLTK